MTTKIPDELKKRVDKFPHINWSEIMRSAILQRIIEEEKNEFTRDHNIIDEAILIMETLKKKTIGNSTEELRQWRAQRS